MTQLRKNVLWMGGLAAVALALGLFAYFGVAKTEERETERKDVEAKLFSPHPAGEKAIDGGNLPAAVFTGLVVKAKGDTTALEKKDGTWRITQPVAAAADAITVDALTSAIATSKFKDLIEESPSDADIEKYGLKSPAWSITAYAYVPDKDGKGADDPSRKREVTIEGGIENTFDGSIYVRRGGEKAIHSMEGGAKWSMEKSTFDLRNKDVFNLEEPKLKRIEVKAKSNAYVLERDDKKAWRLIKPTEEAADTATVSNTLMALRNEHALSFPKDAHLDNAQVEATFTLDSGEVVKVRLGKGDKAIGEIVRGGETVVAELPEAALTDLDKNPQDLRDKTVLTFNRDDVSRVTVAKAGGPDVVVEKVVVDAGPEDWRVSAPEPGPAKKWKLSSLLWNLSSLKATTLGEDKPKSWAKFGLEKPERTASLFDKDGKLLARLAVGRAVEGGASLLYVRGSRDQVLEVDSNRLSDLPVTLTDLLDKPPPAPDAGVAPN